MALSKKLQVRIREISVLDKLQCLYRLLSAVLPVIKQIHLDQCTEVELEKRLRGETSFYVQGRLMYLCILLKFFAVNTSLVYTVGAEIDLVRARLKADEQMCWYIPLTCPYLIKFFYLKELKYYNYVFWELCIIVHVLTEVCFVQQRVSDTSC